MLRLARVSYSNQVHELLSRWRYRVAPPYLGQSLPDPGPDTCFCKLTYLNPPSTPFLIIILCLGTAPGHRVIFSTLESKVYFCPEKGYPLKLYFQIPCFFPVQRQIVPVQIYIICDYNITFSQQIWQYPISLESRNLQLEQTKFPVFWKNF